MKLAWMRIGLGVLFVVLIVGVKFGPDAMGTDDRATQLIHELHPDYQPWTGAVWEPSEAQEQVLFGIQSILGLGLLVYFDLKLRRRSL
jgi:cobalt/nickel transport protein